MTLATSAQSLTWTYVDGDWYEGNVAILGPRSHAMWLGTSVFDGVAVSQPSLSNGIRALESELGGPVFDRSSMALTRLGKRVLPDLETVVRTAEAGFRFTAVSGGDRSVAHVKTPRIGRFASHGTRWRLSFDTLFMSPAMANDWRSARIKV
jgi:hypothetical protein